MTNGGDRHHGPNGKKPEAKKTREEEAKAKLKRKNLLPKAVAGGKK